MSRSLATDGTPRSPRAFVGQIRAHEVISYALAAVLPAAFSFIRGPLYSHWFDPTVFGQFTVVSMAATLGKSVVLAAFSNALYRYYDGHRRLGTLTPFLASVSAGVIGSSALLAPAVAIVSTLWLENKLAAAWGVSLFLVWSAQGMVSQVNRLEHQTGVFVAGRLVDPIWQIGCPVVLMYLGVVGSPSIFLTAVLAGVASTVIGVVWARQQVACARPWEATAPMTSEILRYGLPLVPLTLMNWATAVTDRFVVQWFLGAASTGVYAMGYGLAWTPVAMISSALVMAMGPSVWERANSQGSMSAMTLTQRFTRLYLGLAIPAAVGLAILARRITEAILAPEYVAAAQILAPVGFSAVFGGLYAFLVTPWELHRRTAHLSVYVASALVMGMLLSIWSVRFLGLRGPAWSGLVAYGITASILAVQAVRGFGIYVGPTLRDIASVGLSSGLMGCVIWTMDRHTEDRGLVNLVVIVAAGIIVYLGTWLPLQMDLRRFGLFRPRTGSVAKGLLSDCSRLR